MKAKPAAPDRGRRQTSARQYSRYVSAAHRFDPLENVRRSSGFLPAQTSRWHCPELCHVSGGRCSFLIRPTLIAVANQASWASPSTLDEPNVCALLEQFARPSSRRCFALISRRDVDIDDESARRRSRESELRELRDQIERAVVCFRRPGRRSFQNSAESRNSRLGTAVKRDAPPWGRGWDAEGMVTSPATSARGATDWSPPLPSRERGRRCASSSRLRTRTTCQSNPLGAGVWQELRAHRFAGREIQAAAADWSLHCGFCCPIQISRCRTRWTAFSKR